jgi:hypothetical protein
MEAVHESGEWLIRQVMSESKIGGDQPLDDRDAELLRRPIWEVFEEVDRDFAQRLNNRVVDLVRASITRAKAAGAPTVRARRALHLPEDWHHHYNVVYHANLEWAIAAIMQNALLANRPAGEKKPWKSK